MCPPVRGPYNAWFDPIVIDEWHNIAYQEVREMTAMGVPGVFTHDFYDGWAPNYMFTVANGHNAIGRFYETQGAGDGSTQGDPKQRRAGLGPAQHAPPRDRVVHPEQREPAAERPV